LEIPLINTLLLLTSAIAVTYSHLALRSAKLRVALFNLSISLYLALTFNQRQLYEFCGLMLCISDGAFTSSFFALTGLHALHVAIGITMLYRSRTKMVKLLLAIQEHFSFESSAWYWHFVDVV
jgi:cytochrome c oxidase subunit 3